MSMRMSFGENERSKRRASSASAAVRTSYPSPCSSTRASFKLATLSSTMRSSSPAIRHLIGHGDPQVALQKLHDRFGSALALRNNSLRRFLEQAAVACRDVLDRPNDDRHVAHVRDH